MTFDYKPGVRIKTAANIVGAVCEKLSAENRLTPENLLNISRADDAPLHGEFEWDDTVAAEKYRVEQARHIICALIITPEEKPEVTTRAFVRATEEKHEYTPYRRAIASEDSRGILLRTARRELQSFTYKYSTLEELAEINAAINEFLDSEPQE